MKSSFSANYSARRRSGGGGGVTAQITNAGTTFDVCYILRTDPTTYAASDIVPSSNYTITRIDIPLFKTGSPTFTITVAIYTDNAGSPGTLVGTASTGVSSSVLPSTESTFTSFTGISASVSSGTKYWVVIYKSAGVDNFFADFANLPFYNIGAGTTYKTRQSSDGITWADAANYIDGFDMPGKMVVYSTP